MKHVKSYKKFKAWHFRKDANTFEKKYGKGECFSPTVKKQIKNYLARHRRSK
jgi:hypothetical protein